MRTRIAAIITAFVLILTGFVAIAPGASAASGASYGPINNPRTLTIVDCTTHVWDATATGAKNAWMRAAKKKYGATRLDIETTNASPTNCKAAQDEECDYNNSCIVVRVFNGPNSGRYKVTYHSHNLVLVAVNQWHLTGPSIKDEVARFNRMRAAVGRGLGMPVRHSGTSVMYTRGGNQPGPADVDLLGKFYGAKGGGGGSW